MDNTGQVALQRCTGCYQWMPYTEIVNNRCPECRPKEPSRFTVRGAMRTR